MNLKNSGDSTGFEPMNSAMPVQCSNQLSYEVTQLRAGQFVGLMFSIFHFYNYYIPFFIQERKDWQPSLKILGEKKKTSWYEYELLKS